MLDNDVVMQLYADDVSYFQACPRPLNALQVNLNYLLEWSNMWQLPISYLKCCVLHIGKDTQDCQTFLLGQHKLSLMSQVF